MDKWSAKTDTFYQDIEAWTLSWLNVDSVGTRTHTGLKRMGTCMS